MKTKLLLPACVLAVALALPQNVAAGEADGAAIAADVIIARPLCFAATVVGSAFFLLALPFAAITREVPSTANALVVTPAKATFTRPLGDFDDLEVD
jgi:hypothetical protein